MICPSASIVYFLGRWISEEVCLQSEPSPAIYSRRFCDRSTDLAARERCYRGNVGLKALGLAQFSVDGRRSCDRQHQNHLGIYGSGKFCHPEAASFMI